MEYLNKMISDMAADINLKKDQVIIQKLKDLGITFNLKEDESRRFKRFLCEIKGDEESYYYNDGSLNGIRVVTFVKKAIPIDIGNLSSSLMFEITYY